MTLSPNGYDTKIICRKLTLNENKSLWLIIEVSIFLNIYKYIEPVLFLSFQNKDVFITVLQYFGNFWWLPMKILMIKVIRTATWNKWFEPARRNSSVQLGLRDNNYDANCIIREIIDLDGLYIIFCLHLRPLLYHCSKTKRAELSWK